MPVNATGIFCSLRYLRTGGVLVELTGPMTMAFAPLVIAVRMFDICSVGESWESSSMEFIPSSCALVFAP
jgi:hypothetical protein